MHDKGLVRRYLRPVAKAAWWAVTPWRMGQRMRFLRERSAREARAAELARFVEGDQARRALRHGGAAVPPAEALDLFDDAEVIRAVGLPASAIFCAPMVPAGVTDRWSAARFWIDLWRRRPDLRSRFPFGLAAGGRGPLGAWLEREGRAELGVSDAALPHLLDALDAGLPDRPRQAFLANEAIAAALPHGFTPAGMRGLVRWFMRCGQIENGLRTEEIWWLLLEAAQEPQRELMLAYSFTPQWQQLHPDGLGVFGRNAFASWFAVEYGAAGPWIDPAAWPHWQEPAVQIRSSYWAREPWRAAHPDALADARNARLLLAWLASPEAGLPEAQRDWCRGLDLQTVAEELAGPGLNVVGHFCYPSGLRVSVESMVEAVRLAGVSTSLRDVRTDAKDDPHHVDFRGTECHDVTVIHTQPEPFFDEAYRRADLYERRPRTYRVGYWYWEFDSIPDAWVAHAQNVDEVWAATEFVAKGLREKLSVPVRTLFPGVKLAPYERRPKSYFGLSEAPYTFLFTFHMMSVMERKNPLGLIRAFKLAFGEEEGVRLVLKTSFGDRHPAQIQELRDAAAGANITVIDQVYSPDEVLSLMDACDAYVSLHRSEGLGLTMAEAMLMGKPVIATNFSGNVDFMDESNSLLVRHELVKLGKPIPPYDPNLEWAQPSEEHAAQLMRRVYEDQNWAREVGARGKASAEANLSLQAAGRRIAARLDEIKALRRSVV
ncbi:glycosyltransferase family 4 protein [Variovorax saccharolyticus]|uniref:glycosyltransferase family 4 protein n=1 Tax=Variovorax saccharolyticus TaxID=3053516 RepID=UPI0025753022|nr:glycosyltransferase family 4 protein [Variovorax sp. J31P216]MDM0028703.1 glycosyltransferase family 4 protein [Variovorax sp. J31P216]